MKLKVCGLKDRENILKVLETKPDHIGFIFYKNSPRYAGDLDPAFVHNISGPKKVGVFVNEKEIHILDRVAQYGLDYVQLHGEECPEFCGLISNSVPVIKAFQVDEQFDVNSLPAYQSSCRYFLFDTKSEMRGGSGKTFDHSILEKYELEIPYFLSGGLSLESIPTIKTQAYALDVNSKFEIRPGIKDVQKIKSLTEIIRR